MVVRAMRVECIVPKERREAFRNLARSCQRMQNRLWQIWICHHANNGSAEKLRRHFEAYHEWQSTKSGQKPQWPCRAVEPPLTKSADSRSFYRILSAEFPEVNVRTRGLLTNAWQSLLSSRKASSGSLPGWVSILFGFESVPSFHRPQPIPFDKDNARLLMVDGQCVVRVRLDRDEVSGKSTVDDLPLLLNKRKSRQARVVVDRLLDGEYAWKGSNIIFDRGKWFVALCYEMPAKTACETLDANRILFVRPGKNSPWRVRIGNESWRFGGDGSHVVHARRAIQGERNSRQQHYRWAGSSQKGHGRSRAASVWTKLASRWKDFTKRYNSEITRQLIRICVSRGCGRIVFLQPNDRIRNSRFLTTAGNSPRSSSSWDYFQFGTMLASKCESVGIEYGKPKRKKGKDASNGVRSVRKTVQSKRGVRKEKAAFGV